MRFHIDLTNISAWPASCWTLRWLWVAAQSDRRSTGCHPVADWWRYQRRVDSVRTHTENCLLCSFHSTFQTELTVSEYSTWTPLMMPTCDCMMATACEKCMPDDVHIVRKSTSCIYIIVVRMENNKNINLNTSRIIRMSVSSCRGSQRTAVTTLVAVARVHAYEHACANIHIGMRTL